MERLNSAEAFTAHCGICVHPVGSGHGKRTAAALEGIRIKLMPKQAPQLQGLIVTGTVIICLSCLEQITNDLIKAQHRVVTQQASPTLD